MPTQPTITSIEELDAPVRNDSARACCLICSLCTAPEELDAATIDTGARFCAVCTGFCSK